MMMIVIVNGSDDDEVWNYGHRDNTDDDSDVMMVCIALFHFNSFYS